MSPLAAPEDVGLAAAPVRLPRMKGDSSVWASQAQGAENRVDLILDLGQLRLSLGNVALYLVRAPGMKRDLLSDIEREI